MFSHRTQLLSVPPIILDVLEHLEGDQQIEAAVRLVGHRLVAYLSFSQACQPRCCFGVGRWIGLVGPGSRTDWRISTTSLPSCFRLEDRGGGDDGEPTLDQGRRSEALGLRAGGRTCAGRSLDGRRHHVVRPLVQLDQHVGHHADQGQSEGEPRITIVLVATLKSLSMRS